MSNKQDDMGEVGEEFLANIKRQRELFTEHERVAKEPPSKASVDRLMEIHREIDVLQARQKEIQAQVNKVVESRSIGGVWFTYD